LKQVLFVAPKQKQLVQQKLELEDKQQDDDDDQQANDNENDTGTIIEPAGYCYYNQFLNEFFCSCSLMYFGKTCEIYIPWGLIALDYFYMTVVFFMTIVLGFYALIVVNAFTLKMLCCYKHGTASTRAASSTAIHSGSGDDQQASLIANNQNNNQNNNNNSEATQISTSDVSGQHPKGSVYVAFSALASFCYSLAVISKLAFFIGFIYDLYSPDELAYLPALIFSQCTYASTLCMCIALFIKWTLASGKKTTFCATPCGKATMFSVAAIIIIVAAAVMIPVNMATSKVGLSLFHFICYAVLMILFVGAYRLSFYYTSYSETNSIDKEVVRCFF